MDDNVNIYEEEIEVDYSASIPTAYTTLILDMADVIEGMKAKGLSEVKADGSGRTYRGKLGDEDFVFSEEASDGGKVLYTFRYVFGDKKVFQMDGEQSIELEKDEKSYDSLLRADKIAYHLLGAVK